jgi:transcriptional regulator with XRE-family HTH domain
VAVQTKKPVTGKTQKLAKNPPKQPAKPLKAAKPPALKSKAVTARVKPGTVRKGIPLSGPAPGETKSQLGFASGVLRRKTVKRTGPGPVATLKAPSPVVAIRAKLGLTQDLFARLIGVTQRSVSTWERGGEINDVSLRRVREMDRLADELRKSMREDFIPHWLVSPNEGLGGISPIEAMERGEGGRVWRSVFLLGSGTPL